MTKKKDAYEKSAAERVNGILKSEFNINQSFKSFQIAEAIIENSIRIYYQKRPHLSCNMLTQEQVHKKKGKLTKKWKNYYKKKTKIEK